MEENDDEGYTIKSDLIVKAWKRFRPVTSEQDHHIRKRERERTRRTVIKPIFGVKFVYELMSQIHLRLYNFSELKE